MVAPEEVYTSCQLGVVFVSASISETQGLTYVEAAANGLPLLCSLDAWPDDVLAEGRNGYEYEAEDEFCEIISSVLNNPQWCQIAGTRSEEIAASFDKGNFAAKIEDIYKAVVP